MKTKPNVIRAGLLRSCMSIQSLAAQSGTTTSTVQRALCGKNVNPEKLGRILKVLNIAPEDAIESEVAK